MGVINEHILSVIGAFAFVNECAKWLPGLTVSKQLASLSIFHKIMYFQTPGVWPIKPRYMSVEVRGEHLGQRGAATRRWGHARGSTRCRMRPDRVLRALTGTVQLRAVRGEDRACGGDCEGPSAHPDWRTKSPETAPRGPAARGLTCAPLVLGCPPPVCISERPLTR